jgi:hypothetical protein
MVFHDPKKILIQLRPFQAAVGASDLPATVKTLRKQSFKKYREAWHAAIFAYGYALVRGHSDLRFAPADEEYSDFDAMLSWSAEGTQWLAKLQLKEFVPADLNPKLTIEAMLSDIQKKYPKSPDLIVAIYLNRVGRLPSITIPKLGIGELWFFGWSKPNQEQLTVWGDLMREAKNHHVPFPEKA